MFFFSSISKKYLEVSRVPINLLNCVHAAKIMGFCAFFTSEFNNHEIVIYKNRISFRKMYCVKKHEFALPLSEYNCFFISNNN